MTHTLPAGVPTQLWIGGKLVDSSTGTTFPVEDPATGAVIAHVADAAPEDGRRALEHATTVQGDWARTPSRRRGEILRTAFELIHQRADDLARTITLEMGKPALRS